MQNEVEKPDIKEKPSLDIKSPKPDTNSELGSSPEKPILGQQPAEIAKLTEVRQGLTRYTNTDVQRSGCPIQPAANKELLGFREAPLKVIRNWIRYPTFEISMVLTAASAMAFPFAFATDIIGAPKVGSAALFTAAAVMGYEWIILRSQQRILSDFFKVTKMKPNKEKLLKDGTQVSLDDFVGELHMSSLFRTWKLAFMKDKTQRALIVSEGILQGLANIGQKIKEGDPWYGECKALKGTSWIVNRRIAERFGFEVGADEGGRLASGFMRRIDKAISLVPKIAPSGPIRTAWISTEKFMQIYDSGIIQDELAMIRRGLDRRRDKQGVAYV